MTHQSLNGQAFYAPANADYQTVFNTGRMNGPFNYPGATHSVGHYGIFDYQRNEGQGNLWPKQNNIFYPAYTDASNYSAGVYMRGAGLTFFATYIAGESFAHFYKTKNANSSKLIEWWANGWNAANAQVY